MKKAIYLLVPVFASLLLFVACNKDQKVVKQLDGDWKTTSWTIDGTAQPASTYDTENYHFTACKLKKGDCDGTITDGSFTLPFKYSISEKGEKMTMTYDLLGTKEVVSATIEEHSKSKFVFSTENNGKKSVTTLEKK